MFIQVGSMKNVGYLLCLIIVCSPGCVDQARSGLEDDDQSMGEMTGTEANRAGGDSSEPLSGTDGSPSSGYGDGVDLGLMDNDRSPMADMDVDRPVTESGAPIRPPAPIYLGGERPANYYLPFDYDPGEPMPILIGLHGYTGNASWHNSYLALSEVTQEQGILLITPNGRRNIEGFRFWSATDHCCDEYGQGDLDVAYLSDMIEEAIIHFNIDTSRIAIFGHSNGGFMAYRLACEIPDQFTHVISLSGSSWADAGNCAQPSPVSILHVHGTWDAWARYLGQATQEGDPSATYDFFRCQNRECSSDTRTCNESEECAGMWTCMERCGWGDDDALCRQGCYNSAPAHAQIEWMEHWICLLGRGCYDSPALPLAGYAGAEDIVQRWVTRNQCLNQGDTESPLDLVFTLPGVDTNVTRWSEGCVRHTEVQLWTIERGTHSPQFNPDFSARAIDWFLGTPRAD